jgi:acyl carrier protein
MNEVMSFLTEWLCDWRPDLAHTGLPDETRLVEDLAFDSLALLELVASIEDRFQVHIPDGDFHSAKTFGTLGGVAETVARALRRTTPETTHER